jgi:5-formyltetrahydrofolate cyclo-ligase
MNSLKSREASYWESYLQTLPLEQKPREAFVSAGYAGTPEMTDELLHLYLSGKKTAGSSLVEDFLSAGDALPRVGNYWIYLNSSGEPSCILRTERTVIHKFKDVPLEIAIAEGEGDLTLEYWKRAHSDLYLPHLEQWGIEDLNEATVITEFFSIVYR